MVKNTALLRRWIWYNILKCIFMDDSFIYPKVPAFWDRSRKSQEEALLELQGDTATVVVKEKKDRFKGIKDKIREFGFSYQAAVI